MHLLIPILTLALSPIPCEKPVFINVDQKLRSAAWVAEVELLEVRPAEWMGRVGKGGNIKIRVTSDPSRIWRGYDRLGQVVEIKPPGFGPGSCTAELGSALKAGQRKWLFIASDKGDMLYVAGAIVDVHDRSMYRLHSWCDYNAALLHGSVGTAVRNLPPWESAMDVGRFRLGRHLGKTRATELAPLASAILDPVAAPALDTLGDLVAKLDADASTDRDAAEAALVALGVRALGPLRAALKITRSPEPKLRLGNAIRRIEATAWVARAQGFLATAGPDAMTRLWLDVHSALDGDHATRVDQDLIERARVAGAPSSLAANADQTRAWWRDRLLPPPVVYAQDFKTKDAIKEFSFTDPKVWTVHADEKGGWLGHKPGVKYKPPHRSPRNLALVADQSFGDFTFEAELQQTGREYGHRDLCLFFGYQDPAHFYYVHLATKTDNHAHNIFIVDAKPRTKISTTTTKGIKWGKETWHKVKLVRKAGSGTIEVYFDDLNKPIMTATNKKFARGWVGFGSFDDEGRIRKIRVTSGDAKKERVAAFGAKLKRKK
ncbi:MAG: hypothetical protein CMJ83_05135 [Planctomycetes bacterium]|nr:hypothetical protein [Planctomycetota bacterium]